MENIHVIGTFERCAFPKKAPAESDFRICKFAAKQGAGQIKAGDVFSAKGYGLPCVTGQIGKPFSLNGNVSKNEYGWQMEVERCDEIISKTREGIISYLSSGLIKGIGPKLAERIVDRFGESTLDVLDKSPERIAEVPGIAAAKLEKIKTSLAMNAGATRELITFLSPHGITVNKCMKIFKKYGEDSILIVRQHPFQLCQMSGIGFVQADKVATAAGLDERSPERIAEAMMYVLEQAENGSGHLCLSKADLEKNTTILLDTDLIQFSHAQIARAGSMLMQADRVIKEGDFFYRKAAYRAEDSIAKNIHHMLCMRRAMQIEKIDEKMQAAESALGFILGEEQRKAVRTSIQAPFSVITGGPGTGKTTIINVLLKTYLTEYPGNTILLMAPTGRASRRMTETTGRPGSTIHRALGIMAIDDDTAQDAVETMLEADLVIVDETSMIDVYLAEKLFDSCKQVKQLIFVGDVDQLPSVGPGAILQEIITSQKVPVTRLTQIYRQAGMSAIAINAARIRIGTTKLIENQDFQICEESNEEAAAKLLQEIYIQKVLEHGQDNVVLLCPFKKRGATSVNNMNHILQSLLNPAKPGEESFVRGSHGKEEMVYRIGDPVMTTKNSPTLEYSNGDVGHIVGIRADEDGDKTIDIMFDTGLKLSFTPDKMEVVELAYAFTVHKSQGSEYKVVITTLLKSHYIFLKRNMIYTSISRAKQICIFVGDRKSLSIAIRTESANQRNGFLGKKI